MAAPVLLLVLLTLCGPAPTEGGPAPGQPETDRASATESPPTQIRSIPTPIEIEPTYRLAIPESDEAHAALFHPNGKRLFVVYHGPALDLWKVAVQHWPEILGALCAGLLLAVALVVWRTARRPQTAGQPYCRRCNYNLSAHVGATAVNTAGHGAAAETDVVLCPECGVDLERARPRRGRALWRRTAVPVGLVLAATGGYAAMHALKLPRNGAARNWLDLSSPALLRVAEGNNWPWLARYKTRGDLVKVFDLRTGLATRTVYSSKDRTFFAPRLSPDGEWMFLDGGPSATLARVSTRTGRVASRVTAVAGQRVSLEGGADAVLGFEPDGGTAYVTCHDDIANLTHVVAWDLATGRIDPVLATPGYARDRTSYGRLFALLGGAEKVRFFSVPHFMEAYPTGTFVMRVHTPGEPDRLITSTSKIDPNMHPVVTPDGTMAFATGAYGRQIVGIDLETGVEAGVLDIARPGNAWDKLRVSPDGRFLAVPIHESAVLLRDIRSARWAARLNHPSDLYAAEPTFAPNGRWLAAVCQRGGGGRAGTARTAVTHHAVVWDLAPVLAGTNAAPATSQTDGK